MNAEESLLKIGDIECKIVNTLEEIKRLEAMAEKITPTLSQVSVTSTHDPHRLQGVWTRLVAEKDKLTNEVDEMIKTKNELKEILKNLHSEHYDILFNLYVLRKTVQQIADEKHYTRQAIYYNRDRGLEELQKILDSRKSFDTF